VKEKFMKIGMAFAVGAVLIAIASCGEANKPLAPITAAEVNGEAIIAATSVRASGLATAAPIPNNAIRR